MQCPKCSNQDLEFKSGTAKNTGKPWKAYRCAPCNAMIGMNGLVWGDKPDKNAATGFKSGFNGPSKPQLNPESDIIKKLNQILSILQAEFPDYKEELTTEPEQDPF